MKILSKFLVTLLLVFASTLGAQAGTIGSFFLTGHDPDFHAQGSLGAQHINQIAINFVMDPAFNPFVAGGAKKFLYVAAFPSDFSGSVIPGGHLDGAVGLQDSSLAYSFTQVDAAGLPAALSQLGTTYGAIVVGSSFGGLLRQAELDALNTAAPTIVNFLNSGGGIYAMSEGGVSESLAQGPGWFGYLPCIASAQGLDQVETNDTLTSYGTGLGLANSDVNSNFSHNIFNSTCGLNVVDNNNGIVSLAGRGKVTGGGFNVPEPASITLLVSGLAGLIGIRRRKLVK